MCSLLAQLAIKTFQIKVISAALLDFLSLVLHLSVVITCIPGFVVLLCRKIDKGSSQLNLSESFSS